MNKQAYLWNLLRHYRDLKRQSIMLLNPALDPEQDEEEIQDLMRQVPGLDVPEDKLVIQAELVNCILGQVQDRLAEDNGYQVGRLMRYELDRLDKAILLLDDVERRALTMRFVERRSVKCVGAALSLAPSTVDYHIRKAVRELAWLL